MSMVRGKLEAIREVAAQNLVVGDVLYVERSGKWFDSHAPNTEIKVEVIDLDQLADEYKNSLETKPESRTTAP